MSEQRHNQDLALASRERLSGGIKPRDRERAASQTEVGNLHATANTMVGARNSTQFLENMQQFDGE